MVASSGGTTAAPTAADGLRVRLFDADGHDRPVALDAIDLTNVGDRQLVWVDIDLGAGGSLDPVAGPLGLTARDRRSIEEPDSDAHLVRAVDRVQLSMRSLEPSDEDGVLVRRSIDLIAAPGVVVTVHHGRVAALDRFDASVDAETSLGLLDAGDLLSSVIDELIDGYYQLAESIELEIDRLDQAALRGDVRVDVLAAIVAIRRRVSLVRRTLAPHRGVLAALARPEMEAAAAVGRPWPGLVDRLEGALGAIEGLRDALLGTYDIHMGRAAQRSNDVMKALTILSAVLLPAVVLAGIMGMNFQMPFFDDIRNFFVVIAAMVSFGVVLIGVARWRGWI